MRSFLRKRHPTFERHPNDGLTTHRIEKETSSYYMLLQVEVALVGKRTYAHLGAFL